jgi:hypothetical protein
MEGGSVFFDTLTTSVARSQIGNLQGHWLVVSRSKEEATELIIQTPTKECKRNS